MKQRAVLVEDEKLSLVHLRKLLRDFPQDIEVVGTAMDGPSAVTVIRDHVPDVVFLDINLPGCNGFEVLRQIEQPTRVIFTTAYDRHALQAFEALAIDFLLKPIEREAIQRALGKLRHFAPTQDQTARQLQQLFERMEKLERMTQVGVTESDFRLECKNGNTTEYVPLPDILYLEADGGYTTVHTVKRDYLLRESLQKLEDKLAPRGFVRIHRPTLVNRAWIAAKQRDYDQLVVVLKNVPPTRLEVSRDRAKNLDLT